MSNFRRISFIAIGIYWLACGALMCLRPDLVAPQSLDPLQLNHGATILGILYLLGGTIMLMPSRLARKIFRTRSSTQPEEHLSPRRQWASLLLLWLTGIAAPLTVLIPS